jgi:hypothetical protein
VECPERGPSLREPLRTPVRGMPADGTPRGRTTRRGGGREPIARLHRSERAPRGRATLRGPFGRRRRPLEHIAGPQTPGGAVGDLPDLTTGGCAGLSR